MKLSHLTTSILAAGFLMGCAQAESAATNAAETTKVAASQATEKAKDTMAAAKPSAPGVDISTAPAGTYKSEATHAYITFQYLHQGYARPTLRWNDFEAVVELNPENPTASTLNVTIDTASIDSGVENFDKHLVSADFFAAEAHPKITFNSTSLNQIVTGTGRVTGDLTMKGITKPVELDVVLNKVGENFRSKKPMIGISAKTRIKRSDWDLGKYTPIVGDDVDISIEVEFIKEE